MQYRNIHDRFESYPFHYKALIITVSAFYNSNKAVQIMLIYISHPYGNKESNKQKVEAIIQELIKENSEHTYISPIHAFGFMYDWVSYDDGILMCLRLLERCDFMFVYGDYLASKGCGIEIAYASTYGIPHEIRR